MSNDRESERQLTAQRILKQTVRSLPHNRHRKPTLLLLDGLIRLFETRPSQAFDVSSAVFNLDHWIVFFNPGEADIRL